MQDRLSAVRLLSLTLVLSVVTVSLTACGSSASSDSVTLYSGQHQQTTEALVAAFEKKTGVTVNVRYNDEDTFADGIVQDESHPLCDVFYSENSPVLEYLQAKGLLAPVDKSTLARTPAKYDSPEGDWVGVSARVSVLVYNPSLISRSQLPRRVLQLAEPRYKGRLALAPSETDFQPIVTTVLRSYGRARAISWLRGISANGTGHIYSDNEAVTNQVNRGAVAFGVIDQYYWYRLRAELGPGSTHSKIAYFAPHDPGYVLDVSGAGALKSSKNTAADQRFLAFLVSRKGQEILAHSQSFEYPLGEGVRPQASETSLSRLQPDRIDISALGDGSAARSLLRKANLL